MTLNKREQLIAIVVGSLLAVFLLWNYVVSPLWLDNRADLSKKIADAQKQLDLDKSLLSNRKNVQLEWASLESKGLHSDAAKAAAQMMQTVYDFAGRSGVKIESMRQNRTTRKGNFEEHRFVATGTGSTAGVAPFLYALETAGMPLRIDEVQIRARKDGTDDLGLEMAVTALVYSPKPVIAPGRAGQAPQAPRPATRPATSRPAGSAPAIARPATSQPGVAPAAAQPEKPAESEDAVMARLRARREATLRGDSTPSSQPAGGAQ